MPILEAFTKPLGLDVLKTPAQFNALNGEDKLKAIIDPFIRVLKKVIDEPVTSLLALAPNLAYFAAPGSYGNDSPLQQSLDALLQPLYVLVDTARPFGSFFDRIELDVEALLTFLPEGVNLGDLIQGTWKSTWIEADKLTVLFALLGATGLTKYIEDSGMQGLIKLINNQQAPGPGPLDYSMAPAGIENVSTPTWFGKSQLAFVADNADAVVNWLWRSLFAGNLAGKNYISGLLGGVKIEDSLEATVRGIWGTDVFVKDNLTNIVNQVLDLKEQLDAVTIPGMNGAPDQRLAELLRKLVFIKDGATGIETPLDLDAIVKPFVDYNPATVTITNEATFKAELIKLLKPMAPLLGVLLTESAATPTAPPSHCGCRCPRPSCAGRPSTGPPTAKPPASWTRLPIWTCTRPGAPPAGVPLPLRVSASRCAL